nr:SIR2 family protein [Chloroflexota bacterium]
ITALQHALDGESILFVGAGFSIGAKNIQGQSLKSGPKLAELLCSEASLSDVTRLEDAAEDFIDIFGSDRLINLLQNQFSVHSVADYHIDLANISWKRIYTTNYDNVLETAYQRAGKRLTTVSLSNNIRDIVKGHTICVHLNGCISNLDRESVLHEIKLTDSSYLTSIVSESEWASLFRQDLSSQGQFFLLVILWLTLI